MSFHPNQLRRNLPKAERIDLTLERLARDYRQQLKGAALYAGGNAISRDAVNEEIDRGYLSRLLRYEMAIERQAVMDGELRISRGQLMISQGRKELALECVLDKNRSILELVHEIDPDAKLLATRAVLKNAVQTSVGDSVKSKMKPSLAEPEVETTENAAAQLPQSEERPVDATSSAQQPTSNESERHERTPENPGENINGIIAEALKYRRIEESQIAYLNTLEFTLEGWMKEVASEELLEQAKEILRAATNARSTHFNFRKALTTSLGSALEQSLGALSKASSSRVLNGESGPIVRPEIPGEPDFLGRARDDTKGIPAEQLPAWREAKQKEDARLAFQQKIEQVVSEILERDLALLREEGRKIIEGAVSRALSSPGEDFSPEDHLMREIFLEPGERFPEGVSYFLSLRGIDINRSGTNPLNRDGGYYFPDNFEEPLKAFLYRSSFTLHSYIRATNKMFYDKALLKHDHSLPAKTLGGKHISSEYLKRCIVGELPAGDCLFLGDRLVFIQSNGHYEERMLSDEGLRNRDKRIRSREIPRVRISQPPEAVGISRFPLTRAVEQLSHELTEMIGSAVRTLKENFEYPIEAQVRSFERDCCISLRGRDMKVYPWQPDGVKFPAPITNDLLKELSERLKLYTPFFRASRACHTGPEDYRMRTVDPSDLLKNLREVQSDDLESHSRFLTWSFDSNNLTALAEQLAIALAELDDLNGQELPDPTNVQLIKRNQVRAQRLLELISQLAVCCETKEPIYLDSDLYQQVRSRVPDFPWDSLQVIHSDELSGSLMTAMQNAIVTLPPEAGIGFLLETDPEGALPQTVKIRRSLEAIADKTGNVFNLMDVTTGELEQVEEALKSLERQSPEQIAGRLLSHIAFVLGYPSCRERLTPQEIAQLRYARDRDRSSEPNQIEGAQRGRVERCAALVLKAHHRLISRMAEFADTSQLSSITASKALPALITCDTIVNTAMARRDRAFSPFVAALLSSAEKHFREHLQRHNTTPRGQKKWWLRIVSDFNENYERAGSFTPPQRRYALILLEMYKRFSRTLSPPWNPESALAELQRPGFQKQKES